MTVGASGLRVTAVISSLRPGGAERVLVDLAGGLSRLGHEVTIVTFAPAAEKPFYALDPAIHLCQLGLLGDADAGMPARKLAAAVKRLRGHFRREQSEIVLGFTTVANLIAILASRGLGLKVVAAERVDPAGHNRSIGRFGATIRDLAYRQADHVCVQTEKARKALDYLADDRISVIPNPIPLAREISRPWLPGAEGRFRLIGVGRLERQKGFDLLIPAFAGVADRFPDWDLAIYGEGPARDALQAAIDNAGIADRIHLKGLTREVGAALAASHAMALPSRFEGFPNALTEAMAAGLPAVVFKGVADDLILDGETGLRADPADPIASLAFLLARLMDDGALRTRLGEAARAHVAAFSPDVHNARWDELLRRVAGDRIAGARR